MKFNIPEAEAVDRLKDLIREHDKGLIPHIRQPRSSPPYSAARLSIQKRSAKSSNHAA